MDTQRLKYENQKVKNALIFDLPAGKSCLNSGLCYKFCYGRKAEWMYKAVKKFREENYVLANEKPRTLYRYICRQLTASVSRNNPCNVVRIHSSGDFFNQAYIRLWEAVIKEYPGVKFYAFTKVNKMLNFKALLKLKNFNLIPSLIKDKYPNFGERGYIMWLRDQFKCHICPWTAKNGILCGVHCSYCLTNKNVVFKIH